MDSFTVSIKVKETVEKKPGKEAVEKKRERYGYSLFTEAFRGTLFSHLIVNPFLSSHCKPASLISL